MRKLQTGLTLLFIMIVSMGCISSCTYSINLVNTPGMASDVVDDADIASPSLSLPPMSRSKIWEI